MTGGASSTYGADAVAGVTNFRLRRNFQGLELDGQAGIQELAGDATMLYYMTDEAQEGGRAFLEKRKPKWNF